jgi:SET domain-containing protein
VPEAEVRPSPVAGRGLFARERLAPGAVVLRLDAAPDEGRVDRLGVGFPNHSCDPNVGWVDDLTLATISEVAPGDELLTDYAMSITDPQWLLRCHCPSYRCRQMVEGSDWQIPQLQRRYAAWLAPRVQRLVAGAS